MFVVDMREIVVRFCLHKLYDFLYQSIRQTTGILFAVLYVLQYHDSVHCLSCFQNEFLSDGFSETGCNFELLQQDIQQLVQVTSTRCHSMASLELSGSS